MMGQSDLIQVRVDSDLRKDAMVVLNRIGIDMSSAIRMYLKRIVFDNKIPFDINEINRGDSSIVTIPGKRAHYVHRSEFNDLLLCVPKGKLTRYTDIERYFMKKYNAERIEYTHSILDLDPLWEKYPFWRIVSTRGTLPQTTRWHSQERQIERLEEEGFKIIKCGANGRSLKVENYMDFLFDFGSIGY